MNEPIAGDITAPWNAFDIWKAAHAQDRRRMTARPPHAVIFNGRQYQHG